MNNRFFTLALVLYFLLSLNLNAQPGIILDSVASAPTGQTICIPVKTKGFNCVISMQGSISWDPQVLDYDKTQNYLLPGMGAYSFNYNSQNERLLFSWSDPSALGITKDDGKVLFEICFTVIGPAGNSGYIKIDSAEIVSDCIDGNLWTYVASPPILYTVSFTTSSSELTTSKQLAFTLNPNPASSGARVIFDSNQDGTATFFVTNSLGQTVFEQNCNINIGENQIQIPAGALNTKGAYQVVLQTKQGAVSQLLIVH